MADDGCHLREDTGNFEVIIYANGHRVKSVSNAHLN